MLPRCTRPPSRCRPCSWARLSALMERSSGSPEVTVGLIDGPVAMAHPDLASDHVREVRGSSGARFTQTNSTACLHGTFVAGTLSAKRNSPAPAISPNCTLLIRPVFAERTAGSDHMPSAPPQELAAAIVECIDAGARVIHLSLAVRVRWGAPWSYARLAAVGAARSGASATATCGPPRYRPR
jgi:subtilisin family serine protease